MFRSLFSKYRKYLLAVLLIFFLFQFILKPDDAEVPLKSIEVPSGSTEVPLEKSPRVNVKLSRSEIDDAKARSAEFCVFNQECRIPLVDPFSRDVMAILKPVSLGTCTKELELFSVRYDKLRKQYLLRFDKGLFLERYPKIRKHACFFYEVVSVSSSAKAKWFVLKLTDRLIVFYNHFTSRKKSQPVECHDRIVPRHVEGMVAECVELGNRSHQLNAVLQRDAFAFVQQPPDRNEAVDRERSRSHPTIIMLGIDSMSQMNFQRTMPLTTRFVRQRGWYEMLGYTKIGKDAFTNMLTLLSGLTAKEWKHFCNVEKPGCLDAITYLWNHFHNSGYLAAYAEEFSTFAFTRRPVDLYLNSILQAFREIMQGEHAPPGRHHCLGRRQSFRYVMDYALQLIQRFVNESPKPLFGLFWTSSFSHEDFSAAASVDRDFVGYLQRYQELGLFEKAVVILFSVSGQDKGALMNLKSGFLEERLPMLHVYLPPWYRRKYPQVGEALEVNSHQLLSTYDFHITIKDLLQQVCPNLSFERLCAHCYSILALLPANRSCKNARIPNLWCPCQLHVRLPNNGQMKLLVNIVLYQMNSYLSRDPFHQKCSVLKLEQLISSDCRVDVNFEGRLVRREDGVRNYHLLFTTQPRGVFRALIATDKANSLSDVPLYEIARIDDHRSCVADALANTLCVCRPPN